MRKKEFLVLSVCAGLVAIVAWFMFAPKANATYYSWCHHILGNGVCQEKQFKKCVGDWKSGKCPVIPTATPTPKPYVWCHKMYGDNCKEELKIACRGDWKSGKCPIETPTPTFEPTVEPTVTPDPTITPEPTSIPEVCIGNCGNPPTFAGSSTEPPICGAKSVDERVVNPHVYRKGNMAIVKWWPTAGNKANIYYKQNSSNDWQYAVQVANTGYYEIGGLGSMDITFGIQQVDDCGGGVTSDVYQIVDGNANAWVLYR
ncbi:MAG: hypothetical protein WC938_03805 [Candidatus Paceibacterota bacterium]|jgi:hypothetical protein